MRGIFRLILGGLLLLLLSSCLPEGKSEDQTKRKVSIAVAASLLLPLEELAGEFEKEHSVIIELSPASSGVLTAQIIHGAPFDLFVSADDAYPAKLEELGKTVGRIRSFASGTLLLWSKKELDGASVSSFLTSSEVKTLSIANPDLAPFGAAALEWLKQKELYSEVKNKLVYGENIGNVNQFIASGAVDAALSSVSALNMSQLQQKGHWTELPLAENIKVPHAAVVIKHNKASEAAAQQFLEFLLSDTAQTIFAEYGYLTPEEN